MSNEKSVVLRARLLGSFECTVQGKELQFCGSTNAKMVQLFMLLLLNYPRELSKSNVIEALYQNADSDPSNSLKTLLFRLRRTLAGELGIDENDCILLKGGMLRFSDCIEVQTDVNEFKTVYDLSNNEEDPEKKIGLLKRLVDIYQGEVLPMLSTESWVIYENALIRELYSRSISKLGSLYMKADDYENACQIYKRGLVYYPFEESWIIGEMDALAGQGNPKQALMEYEAITEAMFDEFGVYPSERLMDSLKRISDKMTSTVYSAESVDRTLDEGEVSGAYYCSYPKFVDTYRMLKRIMLRENIESSLMLITLVNKKQEQLEDRDEITPAINILRMSLTKYLRKTDMFTRFSKSQMLVLLWKTPAENVSIVTERLWNSILKEWDRDACMIECSILTDGKTPVTLDINGGFGKKTWRKTK